jgi:DNA polymerase-3 subunit gamma/tau
MSLYQNYRPKSFDDVVGNRHTILSLKKFLETKTLPHALVFFGPSGCGKTTMARILKGAIGCHDMNFMELNGANTRGIDTVREVIINSQYLALYGGPKIFLFDEAHKLTNDAQNALLKILEDTPKDVYFVLCTTDQIKLIKTIKTRITQLAVSALTAAEMRSLLKDVSDKEKKNVSDTVLDEIIRISGGSPRQALVALEHVMTMDPVSAIATLKEIETGVVDAGQMIDICRAMAKGGNWKIVSGLLRTMEIAEPESARIAVLNYLSTVLLGNGSPKIAKMMDCLKETVIYSGKAGLFLALWKGCNESE